MSKLGSDSSLQFRIGKNATENTELVLLASEQDVWFHVADAPSAHLVYFNGLGHDLESLRKSGVIYRMAVELKKASKYRDNVRIIYDYIRNIKTTPKPGLVYTKNPRSIVV